MELLRWIGSVIASIVGLCCLAGVTILIVTFGATLGALGLILVLIVLFAMAIKESWDQRSSRTKPRVR